MSGPAGRAVVYSTASTATVAALVARVYDLPGPLAVEFLMRGLNDVYDVRAPDGRRFVLRLSNERARGAADVAAETAFLAHLDAAGVPVAPAVPTRDGALSTIVAAPEGERPAVLFRHADGRRPDLDSHDDARAQGVTLARVHNAADGYAGRREGYQLDLDWLLHSKVAATLALGDGTAKARRDFEAVAARLAERIARLDGALTRTRCHGDCHGLNARITTAGARAGEAVFFDFDDGGYGFLAYDVGVHLWAQVSFGRARHAVWHAFRQGYESVRALTPADEAALPVFAAIRHIWLLGEWASRTRTAWGREAMTDGFLARETTFLLAWESEQLAPKLLTPVVVARS